jgi:hypothetical protein
MDVDRRLVRGALTRREALRLGAAGVALAARAAGAASSGWIGSGWIASGSASAERVAAGAIRWDAWDAAGSPILRAVEDDLGPLEFRGRAPFCAVASSAESISLARCDTQAAMDAEIAAAAGAGLAYWAYCWYGAGDAMMNAWALHQSSAQRNRVKWCMILQFSRLGADFASTAAAYAGYFGQENYQRVAGGRPLLYLFVDQPEHLGRDFGGSWAKVRAGFDALGAACAKAGLARPYLVVMFGYPGMAHAIRGQLGGDAISNYMARAPGGKPASYEALNLSAQAYWREMAATGSAIVPICLTGWDTRPRKRRPPFWESDRRPDIGLDEYVAAGTPAEIAGQVAEALDYVKGHPESCPARTALIYSWNECDEGGSALVPTYAAAGANRAILDAVGAVLRRP